MVTCHHCGSELLIEAGRCKACGEETAALERSEPLRVEEARLDQVPRRESAPQPGAWGRSDDDAAEGGRAAEVRHLRPTSQEGDVEGDSDHPGEDGAPGMSGDPEADPDPESDAPPGPEEAPRQRPAAAGPPLLASALLRHELAPPHPHPLLGRIIALLAACGGAAAVVATFGTHGAGAGLVAAFAGLGALGLAPMPYGVRAAVLSLIASAGVAGTLWARSLSGAHDELLSATMVVFVTSALFFRAWHRGSVLARVLVAVGIALGVSWLGLRGVDDLSGVDIAWQTWVPHVLKLLLAVLLLLSLLAFMDSRSTGGCNAWATGILLWYAADVGIRWLVRSSPGYGMLQPWASLAYLVAPLLTAVLAVSIAQLLSVTQAGAEPA